MAHNNYNGSNNIPAINGKIYNGIEQDDIYVKPVYVTPKKQINNNNINSKNNNSSLKLVGEAFQNGNHSHEPINSTSDNYSSGSVHLTNGLKSNHKISTDQLTSSLNSVINNKITKTPKKLFPSQPINGFKSGAQIPKITSKEAPLAQTNTPNDSSHVKNSPLSEPLAPAGVAATAEANSCNFHDDTENPNCSTCDKHTNKVRLNVHKANYKLIKSFN